MNFFQKKWLQISIILILGFATRFLWISHPNNVVWDEQHFCNFTKGYLEGKYFFDIHPPLGKFFLLAGLKTQGASTEKLDCAIGNEYPKEYPYVASRVPTAIAGSLLPAVVYLFGNALNLTPATSFFAASFILLDNAIFAESRFGLIDIFVPFFGFLALLCFAHHRKKEPYGKMWWLWLFGSAIAGSLAVATKWTGGGALLVIGFIMFTEIAERRLLKLFFIRLLSLCVVTAGVYMAFFALHFKLLPSSGTGDAFMSERFRASLQGTVEEKDGKLLPPSFLQKTLELNKKMFNVNAAQKLTHQDSSRFYEWPIGRKQIYFWVDKTDNLKRLYLRANPIVWLFGTITMFGSILYLIFRRKALQMLIAKSNEWRARIYSLEFLLLIYFINWLPFAAITRAMFLYHYFSSLIASVLIGAFIVFNLVPALEASGEDGEKILDASDGNRYLYWILLAIAGAAFILFSPLSYGFRPFFS
ncbi:MAG: phospholipid carrier-dependent glycosyltransferase [bacterium]|nr:phospholipid carrier-dependent glycosyltransferase [bacterium]